MGRLSWDAGVMVGGSGKAVVGCWCDGGWKIIDTHKWTVASPYELSDVYGGLTKVNVGGTTVVGCWCDGGW